MSEQDIKQLTLFREGSHASHFPWPENKKEKGMTVTYGRKCSELSPKLNLLGSLVRTYLESSKLPGKQYVRAWSVQDTLSPFLILKLRLSAPRTEEKESFLWPTPTSRDYKDGSAKSCQNVPVNGLLGRTVVQGKNSGSLNPTWVEWLMGYPTGWTELNA